MMILKDKIKIKIIQICNYINLYYFNFIRKLKFCESKLKKKICYVLKKKKQNDNIILEVKRLEKNK
ncbi:MAG: hypothetical protein BHV99_02130 [Clostridium sp. 26_21]|nr:MAG: hypothetical protein BHV99_02130 [Clostridium sp. 26_21]